MKKERMKRGVKLAMLVLSLTFVVAIIIGASNPVRNEVLLQDFSLELKMGLGYGSISGEIKAHAVDFETNGGDNSVTVQLNPWDVELFSFKASRESGNLTITANDRDRYYIDQFSTNGSSFEISCPEGCEIEEIQMANVNSYLNTSNNYDHYNITFRTVENSIVPRMEVKRDHDWYPRFRPYMYVQAGGSGSTLHIYGSNLSISVDGSNEVFSGMTFLVTRHFDHAQISWDSTGFQYSLLPGTEAIIWEPTYLNLGNLTGFIKSEGSAPLTNDRIVSGQFRWVRVWATMWERPWDEWFFVDMRHGELSVITEDERYSMNTQYVTKPSPMFNNEEAQTAYFLVMGTAVVGFQIVIGILELTDVRKRTLESQERKNLPKRSTLKRNRLHKRK